jgi:hypothetical protein
MFFPVTDWFVAFGMTLLVEVPVALVLLRPWRGQPVRLAALVVFANLATHPIVWFVLSQLFLVGTLTYVLVAETWAIVVEAVFYRVAVERLSWSRAVAVAVTANAASFAVGRVIGPLLFEIAYEGG